MCIFNLGPEQNNNATKGVELFHGSPIVIKDLGMKAGTYFTDDVNVAKQYGEVVYKFETTDENIGLFEKDCFDEHWISKRLIPFYMFDILPNMNELDLSILKYYREGKELCGYEGVHDNLCKNDYLDGDLELTTKGHAFIKSYTDWDKIQAFNNKTYVSIKLN